MADNNHLACTYASLILHDEGLARFCTEDYEKPTKENMNNAYMHLTNYSLNKMNYKYKIPN